MDVNTLSVFMLLVCAAVASDKSLVNEKVMTIIDVSSQLVKVKEKITLVNERSESATSYIYIVDPSRKNNLSYIEAEDDRQNSLYVNQVTTNDSSLRFEILFHNSLSPDKTETIDVHTVFINCLQSNPKSVRQHEKHFVVFTFNVYYYSLYFTELQTLVLNAGPIDVNTLDRELYRLTNNSKDGLQYGPFYDMNSEAVYYTSIHYETNSPFMDVENLERFVQLSHWGYIRIWDKVTLLHTGPKLVGPFKRFDNNNKRDTRIDLFVASLPEDAFDIYLKDEIGLIYSFRLDYTNPNSVDVHIKPRFVLYGGWKTQFEIGYSLPIKYYVSYEKVNYNLYNLFIPLVNKLYPDMFIRKAKVNVILPEGAVFQYISPYYELENNGSTKRKYCYVMDLACREVISFEVHNLVDHHSTTNFQLTYSFSQVHMLTKPLVFSAFTYTLLLLLLIYIRLTSNSTLTEKRNRSCQRITQGNQAAAMHSKIEETILIPAKNEGKIKKKLSKSRMKSKKR